MASIPNVRRCYFGYKDFYKIYHCLNILNHYKYRAYLKILISKVFIYFLYDIWYIKILNLYITIRYCVIFWYMYTLCKILKFAKHIYFYHFFYLFSIYFYLKHIYFYHFLWSKHLYFFLPGLKCTLHSHLLLFLFNFNLFKCKFA